MDTARIACCYIKKLKITTYNSLGADWVPWLTIKKIDFYVCPIYCTNGL